MIENGTGALARENVVVALPDLGPTELSASMPAGEAALVVLRAPLARFLSLESPARRGGDPESIHDMRVAARRMRTALRVFADVVPGSADGLRAELRWIARELGEVRDVDVQRGWLSSGADRVSANDLDALRALDDVLVARRGRAHARLVEALDSTRFDRIRIDGIALVRGPSVVSEEASRPLAVVAPAIVTRRYRAMRRAGKSLDAGASSQKLHALRIRCKRTRYALEFVRPLYGKQAATLTRRLVALQDLLGDLRDAELAADRLREMAGGPEGDLASTAFVLGRMAERSARRARKLRRRFPDAYRDAGGGRWKDLKRAMRAPSG